MKERQNPSFEAEVYISYWNPINRPLLKHYLIFSGAIKYFFNNNPWRNIHGIQYSR